MQSPLSLRSLLPRGLAALTLTVALAACSSPVRFATNPQASATPNGRAPAAASPGASAAPAPPVGSGALAQLEGDIRALIARVTPSVVEIDTAEGLGSGIVMDASGEIVTNAHVVGSATTFTVQTSDGHSMPATLVGSYPENDVAVIRVSGDNALTPARFGDSSKARVGDIVLAIGSPLGLTNSVSEGIISALGRMQSESNGVSLTNLIQTTAAVNPGNSGGALVNISGEVIGMPTLATASGRGGGATNIAFAISSNQIVNVTRQLTSGGTVTHSNQPYLGVSMQASSSGEAEIASVVSGGPADKAGLQPGWIILAIGNHSVSSPPGVSQALANYHPGDKVDLKVKLPDGSTKTVKVTVGERPANP